MKKCFVVLVLWIIISFLAFRGPWAHSAEISRWTGIVVHWSDSADMSLDQCTEWHNARGWNGCGYNFLISKSGEVIPARGLERVGAHTKGYNSQFLGICFVGNTAPTEKQVIAFKTFRKELEKELGTLPLFTHAELGHTECPGPALKKMIAEGTL